MSNLINYIATRSKALKIFGCNEQSGFHKNIWQERFCFWPFHKIFMNHIENMGWITYLVFTKSGTDYNIAEDYEKVRMKKIEKDYHALEIATQPTDNIKKLKLCGLQTWRFNSSKGSAQDFLAKESNNHHRSGPLAWKLLTTNILRGAKQGICRAQNMIHMISLKMFDNNIKSLVEYLKRNRKLLPSCVESESSVLANLLRVLKKSPSSEFNSYIGCFQKNTTMAKTLI